MEENKNLQPNTVPVPEFPGQFAISDASLQEQGYDPSVHPSSLQNMTARLAVQGAVETVSAIATNEDHADAIRLTASAVQDLVPKKSTELVMHNGVVLTAEEAGEIRANRQDGIAGN